MESLQYQMLQTNSVSRGYPIPSIDMLIPTKFTLSGDVNAMASQAFRPSMPSIQSASYQPAPRVARGVYSMTSSLPSGIANYNRLSVKTFESELSEKGPQVKYY